MPTFWQKLKKPILALAPIAGVTDSAFRRLCREQGADVVYTEMISADGLFYDSKKTLAFLKFDQKEKPVVAQLFGKRPETFAKAAKFCEQAGFSGVDINFGCPARKVVARGGGVTLMRDLDCCRKIIEAVLAGTKLPVSVKLRTSILKGSRKVTAVDFIKKMKDLPLAAVMVHGRSYETPFDGKIDYVIIKKVKQIFKGVVLGNGGIKTPEDASLMLKKTGGDGVGLARGIYGRPWLFRQVKDYCRQKNYQEPAFNEIKKIILRHAELAFKAKDSRGIVELRKHLCWYTGGLSGAKNLRTRLVKVKNIKEIRDILGKIRA